MALPLFAAVLTGQSLAAERRRHPPEPNRTVAIERAADPAGLAAASGSRHRRRAQAVRVDEALLDGAAPTVDLRVFDDVAPSAALEHIERRGPRDYTWYGRTPGSPSTNVMLTVVDGAVAGTIDLPDHPIAVQPIGPDTEVAQELPNDDLNAQTDLHVDPPAGADHEHAHEGGPAGGIDHPSAPAADAGGTGGTGGSVPATAAAAAPAVIDLLVVYQQVIVNNTGGNPAASVQAAVDQTNQAFANSQINVRVRLVHQQQVPDAELTSIDTIRTSSTVAALRDRYGADLVQGWGTYSGFCGVAYQNSNNAIPAWGFSLIDRNCTSGLTVPHELGHNLGAGHDRANQTSAAFSYSFGWVSIAGDFRTIMTYENRGCPGGSCARVPYFSNPNLTYKGFPLGKADSEDNSRTINILGATIAGYRSPVAVKVAPAISTLTPRSGAGAGGTTVTLTGTGFTGTTGIVIGWARVTTFTVVSDTTITLKTPANFLGWWSFRVTNGAGTSPDVLNGWYRYT